MKGQPVAVLQHDNHGPDNLVILLFTHILGRFGGKNLAAEVTAQLLQLKDLRRQGGRSLETHQGLELLDGIKLPLGTLPTLFTSLQTLDGNLDPLGLPVDIGTISAMIRFLRG